MKLILGKMSSKQLAEWFGVTYNTYRNNIPKYLEKLKSFAEFEPIYGGVNIIEIIVDKYDKKLDKNNDLLYLKEVISCQDGLASLSGIAQKYAGQYKGISEKSIERQLAKSRNRLFGQLDWQDKKGSGRGMAGYRQYVWAVKLDGPNNYRYMTQEEMQLFDALIENVYGGLNPQTIKEAGLLDVMFKESDMTKEEYLYLKEVNGFDFFHEVIKKFKTQTGIQIVHATKHDIEREEYNSPEDKVYVEHLHQQIA